MYADYELRIVPLSMALWRQRVEAFLATCGLRLESVDTYVVATPLGDDTIVAGGGLHGSTIKCVAVADAQRGSGLMQRVISELMNMAHHNGMSCVRVFTKPDNVDVFDSLGFTLLATAPHAVIMENGMGGIEEYCGYLQGNRRNAADKAGTPQADGMIVMNANPFTTGHRALVEWAANQVGTLYVIVVDEDVSMFTTAERLQMVTAGCRHLSNVVVLHGSYYTISAATFPTYFLKSLDSATDTHITLDLALCARHIAPALGATVRFVGDEPRDAVTARYVELMLKQLPAQGIEVSVMPRVAHGGEPVSASRVRELLLAHRLHDTRALVPATTMATIIGVLANTALTTELDTTPKPGLVDRHDNGAHADMDYRLMHRSIASLRQPMVEMAMLCACDNRPSASQVQRIGITTESVMLEATGGVNTHRGAIFALGLLTCCASHLMYVHGIVTAEALQSAVASLAQELTYTGTSTHGGEAVRKHHVSGAMAIAREGYAMLFADWLPHYRSLSGDAWQCHKTLLHIMSTLDDTNVIHRMGYERAQQVKAEARQLADDFSPTALEALNHRYNTEGISPGGAADMLALTILAADLTMAPNR